MRRLIVIPVAVSVLCFLPLAAWGISGKVVDHMGKPISGATVIVVDESAPPLRDFKADDKGEILPNAEDLGIPPGHMTMDTFKMVIRVLDERGQPAPGAKVSMPMGRGGASSTIQTDAEGNFEYTPKPEGRICVIRVVDVEGKPLPNSSVVFESEVFGNAPPVVTDSKGEHTVQMADEAAQCVRIAAFAQGYSYAASPLDGESKEPIVLTLWPEMTLRGKVVDETGTPLAGARVAVEDFYGRDHRGSDVSVNAWSMPENDDWTTSSALDGSFELRHLADPGGFEDYTLSLEVTKEGRAVISPHLTREELDKPLIITLPQEARVTGVMYLPGKSGVVPQDTGVRLEVASSNGNSTSFETGVNLKGEFSFSKLSPGKVVLRLGSAQRGHHEEGTSPVEQHPWVITPVTVDLAPGQTHNVELVATRGALLQGVAVDKRTGKPIAKAKIGLSDKTMSTDDDGTITNQDGQFSLRIPAGEALIQVVEAEDVHGNSVYLGHSMHRPSARVEAQEGQDQDDLRLEFDLRQAMPSSLYGTPIPEDFELVAGSYELQWDQELSSTDRGADVLMGERGKALATKLPSLVTESPLFAAFRMDGVGEEGLLLAVLDESRGTGTGYDTIYIDANRNRDLSDDARLNRDPEPNRITFPWTSVTSRQGAESEQTTNPILVRMYSHQDVTSDLRIARKGGWITHVDSTKGKVELALMDTNSNGRYGELSLGTENYEFDRSGDHGWIDTTGYGYAATHLDGPHEVSLHQVTKVGNRFYRFRSNSSGNRIEIAPYEGETGELKVSNGDIAGVETELGMVSTVSKHGVYDVDDFTVPLRLPTGNYSVQCTLDLPQARPGRPSRDEISLSIDTERSLLVEAGKLTEVTISGDLSCALYPDKAEVLLLSGRKEQPVDWVVSVGSVGKMSHFYGGQGNYEPVVEIFGDNDTLLHRTTLEFTCGDYYGYVVDVPEIEPGSYTLRVSLDTKSKLGVLSAERQVKIVAPATSNDAATSCQGRDRDRTQPGCG